MTIRMEQLRSTRAAVLGDDRGYFPVVATVTGRDALLVWRAGAGHMGAGGRLEAVRCDDGQRWSDPVVIADSEWDDRNPAVGVTPSGTVVVAYHVNGCYRGQRDYDPGLGRFRTRLARSPDGGRMWEKPYPLDLAEFDGLSPYGQMLTLPDGGLLMPIYGTPDWKEGGRGPSRSFLLRSADEGLTWSRFSEVGAGINETAALPLDDGGLLAAVRADGDARLLTTFGTGRRIEWASPADLTAPVDHPACLTRLGDGTILLCHGHRQEPFGARGLLSRDGGRTWRKDRPIVFSDAAENWDCGYPSTVRLSDGQAVTAWYSTAGSGDVWSCRGARCHVMTWREEELLAAADRA